MVPIFIRFIFVKGLRTVGSKMFFKSLEDSEESMFNFRLGRGAREGFVERMLLELDLSDESAR